MAKKGKLMTQVPLGGGGAEPDTLTALAQILGSKAPGLTPVDDISKQLRVSASDIETALLGVNGLDRLPLNKDLTKRELMRVLCELARTLDDSAIEELFAAEGSNLKAFGDEDGPFRLKLAPYAAGLLVQRRGDLLGLAYTPLLLRYEGEDGRYLNTIIVPAHGGEAFFVDRDIATSDGGLLPFQASNDKRVVGFNPVELSDNKKRSVSVSTHGRLLN